MNGINLIPKKQSSVNSFFKKNADFYLLDYQQLTKKHLFLLQKTPSSISPS
jgi:hypothetical protein